MTKRSTYNPDLQFIKENWDGNPLNSSNQYINLDGPSERTFKELFRWQTGTKAFKQEKKNQKTNVAVINNTTLLDNTDEGITWIGHATFLFHLDGKRFITDPVLYNIGPVKRQTVLPCSPHTFTNIDYILLSHNHRDHLDKKSMQVLTNQNPNAIILTALGINKILRSWNINNDIIEAGWYQEYNIDSNVKITFLPAKHWNRRGLTDLNEMLWGSFMLQSIEKTIYFGADSGMGSHFEEIATLFPNIYCAILGIGAYMPEWFMLTAHTSPQDAYKAFQILKAKYMIPMHYGTFDLSDEPIYYPKNVLMELVNDNPIKDVLFLDIGGSLKI
jgi:L-ascorbate metabolism protein UlaG (beta-lactamase superfamily)